MSAGAIVAGTAANYGQRAVPVRGRALERRAWRPSNPLVITLATGPVKIGPGHWVVEERLGADGAWIRRALTDAEFRELYEVAGYPEDMAR